MVVEVEEYQGLITLKNRLRKSNNPLKRTTQTQSRRWQGYSRGERQFITTMT